MTCSVCGNPEKNYSPPMGVDSVCSTCVQKSLAGGDPLEFKRGYIWALFLENEKWITAIEKYWMIVPGDPNKKHIAHDLALKESLRDQIHPRTYAARRAYFKAWLESECCADNCGEFCDTCDSYLKRGIAFKPVPHHLSKDIDIDIRRFMEKYQRFWMKSEQDKALKIYKKGVVNDHREIFNRKDDDNPLRIREGDSGEGLGLFGKQEEFTGNPIERAEEMFLRS